MARFSKLLKSFRVSGVPASLEGALHKTENNPRLAQHNESIIPSILITTTGEVQSDPESMKGYARCTLLANVAELPVGLVELLESSSEGCSICKMFISVLEVTTKTLGIKEMSSWRDVAGVFGLCVKRSLSEEDNNGISEEPTTSVLVLAVNGGESF